MIKSGNKVFYMENGSLKHLTLEFITTVVPTEKWVYDLLREICDVRTWEGESKHSARGVLLSFTRRIMEVTK